MCAIAIDLEWLYKRFSALEFQVEIMKQFMEWKGIILFNNVNNYETNTELVESCAENFLEDDSDTLLFGEEVKSKTVEQDFKDSETTEVEESKNELLY
ncbi:hypothetical protein FQA39_LY08288 [Lamprigera yunnana]|nr:hypothetical protein FQA39_LY08288 [Lamprigera yunnana]